MRRERCWNQSAIGLTKELKRLISGGHARLKSPCNDLHTAQRRLIGPNANTRRRSRRGDRISLPPAWFAAVHEPGWAHLRHHDVTWLSIRSDRAYGAQFRSRISSRAHA